MRIGFATIYSWRPHVEHLYFLAKLVQQAGHEAFFLTCDGNLPTCYTRELRDKAAWRECLECRLGGIRSFASHNVASLGRYMRTAGPGVVATKPWALSSASTLGRFESDADYASAEFSALAARLYPTVEHSYRAASAWIQDRRLDAVCVFNGRIDATRAIFEAARAHNRHVVSLERTWFGDGLQLYPDENCLGLRSVHALVAAWKDRPLTRTQAMRAASHIAARFLRINVREWRAYNTSARKLPWPVEAPRRRVLIVPSSRNEMWGHPDWTSQWSDPTAAFEAVMAHLHLGARDVVLRCHPNWGEPIGKRDGALCEAHYTAWANRMGVHCIPSRDTVSTQGLIEQSDAVMVAHGSAALDAAFLGKQVIGTAPSPYQGAGFRDAAGNMEELAALQLRADLPTPQRAEHARQVARQALRYCYTVAYRVAQYTRYVRADATTRFRYDLSASPERFLELLRGAPLSADDDTSAEDQDGETAVLELIRQHQWSAIHAAAAEAEPGKLRTLRRRLLLRPVDVVRRRKPLGDRLTMRSPQA